MELIITNKQVNKIFKEGGGLDREEVQGINYEVIEHSKRPFEIEARKAKK